MDASLFAIQPAAAEPIYRQLLGQLQRLIAGGQLVAGERLPSVREMAGFHAINPMTVSRAWNMAEAEGLLVRQRGIGMVVTASPVSSHHRQQRLALLQPQLDALVRQAHELELPAEVVLKRLAALLGDKPTFNRGSKLEKLS